jgi:acyl carrier protein
MTESEIFSVVQTAIREETSSHDIVITKEMTADDVPGWDSLAHSRIVLSIEIAVGRPIDIYDTYNAATIGELIEVVRKAVDNRG